MEGNVENLSNQPPRPIRRPGKVKVVRALYNYTAQHADELSFDEGQVLYVYDRDTQSNWWKAKCGDKDGLIPSNYVEEQTEEVELPLHEAARRGNISFLTECLKSGVSPTGLDAAGNTPLYWAARAGHIDCVRYLLNLEMSSAINAQNKMGDTPLHIAASHKHLETIELLLAFGADTSLRNNDNLLAENLTCDAAIINAIQLTKRKPCDDRDYGYGADDYNDDSE
ncbi:osteoclast-stimulating factor 1-like [Aphidius gifuensis]|uniref:osteoclast-stimulating factor 1-like n=1 Tax=Aphidius gifuensis TaxID=684658 RepID=UPI001CDBC1D9|nr:osteoclast-stimulating factor 1-like [Aphidius gifuensis]